MCRIPGVGLNRLTLIPDMPHIDTSPALTEIKATQQPPIG